MGVRASKQVMLDDTAYSHLDAISFGRGLRRAGRHRDHGVVVGLTFLFGFGNVLNLALRLGVPVWVAPRVAPAVAADTLRFQLSIGATQARRLVKAVRSEYQQWIDGDQRFD